MSFRLSNYATPSRTKKPGSHGVAVDLGSLKASRVSYARGSTRRSYGRNDEILDNPISHFYNRLL
jgi:hypothetical protein